MEEILKKGTKLANKFIDFNRNNYSPYNSV